MKEKVIAVFDIGKTNKKIILFDDKLNPVYESEQVVAEITDDEGFPCDDIEKIENWIIGTLNDLAGSSKFDLVAVNFATYGATLVYINKEGKRIGPAYNYLKPVDDRIPESIYRKYGGQDEFCRRTASPALGMLNSGMQALWLKRTKKGIFSELSHILHLPQYLSYLVTGKIYSEHTSIGCHTAIWDFDKMTYHQWINNEGLVFPEPSDITTYNTVTIGNKPVHVGIGIHDSSSSLVPYFIASSGNFILMSTGTWCINMNPFNDELLTANQLDNDCLCYLSITKQPVKSSRLFLGHLHETGARRISEHFKVAADFYKPVKPDDQLLNKCRKRGRRFFDNAPFSRELKENIDFFEFSSHIEAYHQLNLDLSELTAESLLLVLPEKNSIENIFITGGFSKNNIFLKLIAEAFKDKHIYTSQISNATALGAALVINSAINPEYRPNINLGLKKV